MFKKISIFSLIWILTVFGFGCANGVESVTSLSRNEISESSTTKPPLISKFSPTRDGFWFIKNGILSFFNLGSGSVEVQGTAEGVYFRDSNLGWYYADSGLRFTSNGGGHWEDVAINRAEHDGSMIGGHPLFASARIGSLRTGSEVWLTVDAGRNWSLIYPTRKYSSHTLKAYLTQVYFFDESVMWLLMTNGRMLRRAIEDRTWSEVSLEGKGDLLGIHCFEANECLIGVNAGNGMYRTIDGGKSWTKVKTSMSMSNLLSISFGSRTTGLAIEERIASSPYEKPKADDNRLIRSTDGGMTWIPVSSVTDPLEEVRFVDQNTAWILGRDSVFLSEDSGRTWRKVIALRDL